MPATEQARGQAEHWGGALRPETAFRLQVCGDRLRERSLALWPGQLSECGNVLPGAEPREPWRHGDGAKPSMPRLRPSPLTRAALLQLLHGHRLAWRGWVLHTAQQGLHKAGPVGRADTDVVPGLVLEPVLASGVQAHQDRGPAGGEEGQLQGVVGGTWEEEGAGCGEGGAGTGVCLGAGGVFLTWTCCFAGFPRRGLWPGTSSSCARESGLGAGGETSLSEGAGAWESVLGPWRVPWAAGAAGGQGAPGSSWRPSAWALSRYLWRFQLRLGLNMSRAAALASSPTQKVSQEA